MNRHLHIPSSHRHLQLLLLGSISVKIRDLIGDASAGEILVDILWTGGKDGEFWLPQDELRSQSLEIRIRSELKKKEVKA
ncbi:hypothetical protein L1887_10725 [Cichorium endivia]|nr:hypothetical protein L1887_10725 [Cichorium endivia]